MSCVPDLYKSTLNFQNLHKKIFSWFMLDLVNDSGMVPVSFVLYQNSHLFQSQLLRNESTSIVTRQVGSRVISATVEGLEIMNLNEPVSLTFLITNKVGSDF